MSTPVEALLETYLRYLAAERGLAPVSLEDYERVARLFLTDAAARGTGQLTTLTTADVTGFVLRETRHRSVKTSKKVVTMLRSLLHFLYLQGVTERPLAAAVPPVAGWEMRSLPRGLATDDVATLLASCVPDSAAGRRDRAILLLLVRLGLRAGEAAALRLDDVDWRRGEVVIRGKGRREERLPLPAEVGEAVAEYVRWSRPPDRGRPLFFTARAPYHAMTRQGVSAMVQVAGRRAGLGTVGAHRLRHTVATEMLRAGAGLAEIGQVLRHRSMQTTAIYAKVDRSALRCLARPWPGGPA